MTTLYSFVEAVYDNIVYNLKALNWKIFIFMVEVLKYRFRKIWLFLFDVLRWLSKLIFWKKQCKPHPIFDMAELSPIVKIWIKCLKSTENSLCWFIINILICCWFHKEVMFFADCFLLEPSSHGVFQIFSRVINLQIETFQQSRKFFQNQYICQFINCQKCIFY